MDRIIEKKKGIRKKHIPYILGGALVLAFVAWLIFGDHQSKLKVDGRMILTGTVEKGLFNDYVRVNGQVQPITTIQLSPLEGGMVDQIVVEEGSMVKKGDIILQLSNPQLALSILESEASLAEKENFLRNTIVEMEKQKLDLEQNRLQLNLDVERKERKYKQYEKLYGEKLISLEDYLQAKEDYEFSISSRDLVLARQKQDSIYRTIQIENMEESLESMRRSMILIRQREDNLNVKSPINGQLGNLEVVLGQSLNSGANIGQINDLSDHKIEAMIDEHYIDRVRSGLNGSFERQSVKYPVVVNKVYPDVRGGQFRTDFQFTGERPDNIRTGQTYYINLELGLPTDALIIPRGNFYHKTGGAWIYVINADGTKATKRNIRIGRQNPNYYEVLEGLEAGEKVIISGYDNYGDNDVLILN
ncbi:HlyD family efflux transporter periplasmic adaptor subunit [Bacteroidales bacterium OttesenSCG-928-K03]|nr:HlyD family efflux transporter periplasmic adaptor subunit [Bacteroidales bacterium OttesenSCG-928-L14]MDL2240249.1 HlyD family efflux transporter periplasmic adaptor subunit [Bacteroidales bacterium OttesenSCG-928-K22]MDL2242415.1 HlyD family efflux transporter periplasmic adaptor subunit [Bacteroidales bacterium OttesenSCG-928-K03]